MTEPLADPVLQGPVRRLDPLSAQLQRIRDLTGRDVLLESPDGEIVGHALGQQANGAVCGAVLSRSARPLREALCDSRPVALATAGPVRSARVQGQTATLVPVPTAAGPGRLWLLGQDLAPVDALLQVLVDELGRLADRVVQVPDLDVAAIIDGRLSLPEGLDSCRNYLLVAAGVTGGIEVLRAAARVSANRLLMHVGVHQGVEVALLSSPSHLRTEELAEMIGGWGEPYGIRSVLAPWSADQRPGAMDHARQALRVAEPGCSVVTQLRSRVFLSRLCAAVGDLRLPGDDPVANLLQQQPEFAVALLAWLDAHGNTRAAAASEPCHANTMRYRVRRAGELLPGDLNDPAFRLEVHVRLTAALCASTPAAVSAER